MFTLKSIIGSNKAIVLSLVIVAFVALAGRAVMASEPTIQEIAAENYLAQKRIMAKHQASHDIWVDANLASVINLQCMQDLDECPPCIKTRDCPFTNGAPSAE